MTTTPDGPGYYRCHNDVFYAANLTEATDAALRRFLGGPQRTPDPMRMMARAYPRTRAMRLYPRPQGAPRVVEQRPGVIRIEHGNREELVLEVRRVGNLNMFSLSRQVEQAAPIIRLYVAQMLDAAQDGHPAVRVSNRSGLPVFTDDYYRCWTSPGNPHLDYTDPARAGGQILAAGIGGVE